MVLLLYLESSPNISNWFFSDELSKDQLAVLVEPSFTFTINTNILNMLIYYMLPYGITINVIHYYVSYIMYSFIYIIYNVSYIYI